jgi:hypothetical protein
VCDSETPGSHVRLITGSIGWWTWLLWWHGKPFMVKAPACSRCAWKLHGLRFLSLAVMIVLASIALSVIWPHIKDSVPRGLRRWAMLGVMLVCVMPQFIFEVFFAKPFGVTAFADSVDYEFTRREYAIEFALLNDNAAWVKINGNSLT